MGLRIYDAVQQVNIFFSNVMLMQKKHAKGKIIHAM
jgi:hypothetical protein